MSENNHFDQGDVGEEEEIKWTGNPKYESQIGAIFSGLITFPMGIGILILISVYVRVNYTTYGVTDKALYHKKGMLSDKTKRVPLTKIQNTEYSRSWIEKQFEFGTVEISTAGSSGKELTFNAVPEPKRIQELINELSRQYKNNDQQVNNKSENVSDEDLKKEVTKTRENLEEIVDYLEDKN